MSDPTTTGVINEVFQNNLDVIVQNFGQIQGTSSRLLLGLATIEFLLFLYGSYKARSEEVIAKAIEKLFLIFVVALLTFNWGAVAGWMRGYIGGGGAGVGGGNAMITSMNPAHVASDGLDKVSVIFSPEGQRALMEGSFFNDPEAAKRKREREAAAKKRKEDQGLFAQATGFDSESMLDGLTDAGTEIGTMLIVGLIFCGLALLIVFVHFYVALQLFVLTIDWYLTVAMTNLLVPFAVNKHTSSLASAAFQAVVRKSVQLGVMMAILGMFGNTIQGLGLGPQPTMVDVLSLLLGSLTMAFMVKNIPQIASSIFSGGGGTVDVGGTLQAAAASMASRTAAAMSGGASTAAGVAAQGAGMAAGAGFEAGRKGAQLAGQGASRMGRAGLEGAASLGGRARDLMKSEDPGRGGRDAEPKSLEELHKMQLTESSRVSNQVEQNSLGSMQVDSTGNVQNASSSGPDFAQTRQEDEGSPRQTSSSSMSSSGESASNPARTHASQDAHTSSTTSSTSPSPGNQDNDDDKE